MTADDLFAQGLDAAIDASNQIKGLGADTIVIDDPRPLSPPEKFSLTSENYFSKEASRLYWSNSRFGNWLKCAAKQNAIEKGDYIPDDDKPHFIGGRYAHMLTLEPDRQAEYDELYPKVRKQIPPEEQKSAADWKALAAELKVAHKGNASRKVIVDLIREAGHEDLIPPVKDSYGSDFAWIETAIACFHRQSVLHQAIQRGEQEVVLTFQLGGVDWKCMIDNLRVCDEQFDDVKFMKDFKETWSKPRRQYVAWYELRDYIRQSAVYQNAIAQNYEGSLYTPNIFGFSKEKVADCTWEQFVDQQDLNRRVEFVEQAMPQFLAYINGDLEPPRCEERDCDYCRATKVIRRPNRPMFGAVA